MIWEFFETLRDEDVPRNVSRLFRYLVSLRFKLMGQLGATSMLQPGRHLDSVKNLGRALAIGVVLRDKSLCREVVVR
jgi:hypothetical protein